MSAVVAECMAGWIQMPLVTEVGLGPGHRLLCLSCVSVCDVGVLWPKGWMDQNEPWHGGRPWPRPHSVRWKSSSYSPKKRAEPPIFGPFLLWQSWMHQDATCMEVGLSPGDSVLDWDPAELPSLKRRRSRPSFLRISVVAKWLDGSRCHLVWRLGLDPDHIVLDGDPAPLPKREHSPQFSAHVYYAQTAGWIKMPLVWR